jgi:hypothetical protein
MRSAGLSSWDDSLTVAGSPRSPRAPSPARDPGAGCGATATPILPRISTRMDKIRSANGGGGAPSGEHHAGPDAGPAASLGGLRAAVPRLKLPPRGARGRAAGAGVPNPSPPDAPRAGRSGRGGVSATAQKPAGAAGAPQGSRPNRSLRQMCCCGMPAGPVQTR